MTDLLHHPEPEALAAFVDRGLGTDEHRRMVEHLASCADCRELVAEVVRFQEEEAPRGRLVDRRLAGQGFHVGRLSGGRLAGALAAVAAVAALAAVLVTGVLPWRDAPDPAAAVYLFSPTGDDGLAERLAAAPPLAAGSDLARRARAVYEPVRRATGVPARLATVETAGGGPVAVAVAGDRSVVVDRAALELLLEDRPANEAAALAAFVFAHELHHLRADLAARAADGEPAGEAPAAPDAEALADRGALVALTAAGFDPRPVVGEPGAELFAEWLRRSGRAAGGPTDADGPAARVGRLRANLAAAVAALPLFEAAVAALDRGDPEAAVADLERFRAVYDGPEVLANLGLAHFQRAAAALGDCDGSRVLRFVPPVAISRETPLTRLRGPSDCLEAPAVERAADAAQRVLEESARRYPGHLPTQLDLAAVYLLRELPFAAEEAALRARELAPDDPRATAAVLVARYLQSGDPPRPAPALLAELAAARERFPADAALAHAHGRVLAEQGREEEAARAWRRALELGLPEPWAEAVRERLEGLG